MQSAALEFRDRRLAEPDQAAEGLLGQAALAAPVANSVLHAPAFEARSPRPKFPNWKLYAYARDF